MVGEFGFGGGVDAGLEKSWEAGDVVGAVAAASGGGEE